MNAQILKQTSVTQTLCVPILKDPMSVGAWKVLRATGETVPVSPSFSASRRVFFHFSHLMWKFIFVFTFVEIPPPCSPSCDPNATCVEDGANYVCICDDGFEGDGYKCTGMYSILWPAYLEFLIRLLDYKLFAFAAIFTNIQPFTGCPQSKILKRAQYYITCTVAFKNALLISERSCYRQSFPSLCCTHNLTPVNIIRSAKQRRIPCSGPQMNARNYRMCVSDFLSPWLATASQQANHSAFLNSGTQNKAFGAVSQTGVILRLQRMLVLS